MKSFALIENGIVVNLIVAESYEVADSLNDLLVVEYTPENQAYIGYAWDEVNGFDSPKPDPNYVPRPAPEGFVP